MQSLYHGGLLAFLTAASQKRGENGNEAVCIRRGEPTFSLWEVQFHYEGPRQYSRRKSLPIPLPTRSRKEGELGQVCASGGLLLQFMQGNMWEMKGYWTLFREVPS